MKRRFGVFAVILTVCVLLGCLTPAAAFADAEIAKVTVRTEPSNPGVLSSISSITATVSSNNGSIAAMDWYDSAGNLDTDTVDNCTYTVYIRVTPQAGCIFSAALEGSINNALCSVSVAADGSYADLSRTIEPALIAPTIWWSPTSETVETGGLASFVATASPYYSSLQWNLISPEGSTSKIETVTGKFPGVSYTQDDSIGRLNIHNVTADMDGWKVSCTFTGEGGSATTSAASINVKGAVKPTPTPSPSPAATPEPDAGGGSGEPTADEHTHEFAEGWSFDAYGHWHKCDCGEKGEYDQHSLTWTTLREATKKQAGEEKGVCDICGYETARALEYDAAAGNSGTLRIILYIIAGVVALVIVFIVLQYISYNRKRRKRRKNAKGRRY